MYVTYHFAHRETLRRARSWLLHAGFEPQQIETHTEGVPRLSVSTTPGQLDAVHLLISAVERSDPHRFPSFWDVARFDRVPPEAIREETPLLPPSRKASEIGWHPQEPVATPFHESYDFLEMMRR